MSAPFYDPSLSYQENYDLGPFGPCHDAYLQLNSLPNKVGTRRNADSHAQRFGAAPVLRQGSWPPQMPE